MTATINLVDMISREVPRLVPVLNRWIERNKDYWTPPKDESNKIANSLDFCLEDMRTDKQVEDILMKARLSLEESIKKLGAYRVDSVELREIPERRHSPVYFLQAKCSV